MTLDAARPIARTIEIMLADAELEEGDLVDWCDLTPMGLVLAEGHEAALRIASHFCATA